MYYVGIDIGGMSIKFGLVDEEGAIIYKTVLSVDYNEVSIEKTISLMKDKIEELCTGAKIHLKDIKGIGIGCPGVCNTDEGILVNAPNLKWQDVHIREMFADLRIPTFICNDANVALIGEATFGAGKGFKDLLLLTLGTGVGGGIIIDGKLFEGVGYMGGELGHMIIEMDGRECGCGHKGCLEAYASVSALIKDTKEEMLKNKKSKMWDACLGDINQVNGRTAFETCLIGDESANKVVNNYIKYLGEGIRSLLNIFRPEAIIIGGGLSGQKDNLINRINTYLDSVDWGMKGTPKAKIFVSNFGNDAGIIGAAGLAMKGVKNLL